VSSLKKGRYPNRYLSHFSPKVLIAETRKKAIGRMALLLEFLRSFTNILTVVVDCFPKLAEARWFTRFAAGYS
jgi:hypothetical protein